jgi:hypothetical protein
MRLRRRIRREIYGGGSSSSTAREKLTGGGGRGSARSSELRRSMAMCAGTLSSMRKPTVAVASSGAASFSGELRVLAAATILQLEVSGG